MDDNERSLLVELLQLAQDKQIHYTQAQLKKMSKEKLEEIMQELNEALADIAIQKIDKYSKTFNLIKKESKLAQKLQDRKLFKRDLKSMMSWVTPLLPFVGLLEGAVVYGLEVIDKLAEKRKRNKNDDSSPQTEKGDQQDPSASKPDSNED